MSSPAVTSRLSPKQRTDKKLLDRKHADLEKDLEKSDEFSAYRTTPNDQLEDAIAKLSPFLIVGSCREFNIT